MKKFLKIFLISVVVILALLIIIPFAFRGRILEIAKTEINKNLNARVEFADLRLSLLRNFPNLSVTLTEFSVTGIDEFISDTLVSISSFRTVVDLKSVIMSDVIQIRSVRLDEPRVKALVSADGKANWDIMIEPEETPRVTDEEPFEFQVQMKRFDVRNGFIEYNDIPLEFRTTLGGLDLTMHGDLTQDLTSLDISATSEVFDAWFENIKYVHNARLSVATLLDADLVNFMFTFRDADVVLNDLEMGIDGFFAMPHDEIEMDIDFFSKRTDFKAFLSLVPAIFMTGFEELESSGYLMLEGNASGVMNDETMPSVRMDLAVEDGSFKYPDLPESVDNVNLNLNLFFDGVDEDRTTVDLQNFYMEMAGNPLEMKMSIRTPVSDMAIDVSAVGTVNFTSLADVVPLDDVVVRGLLETDFFFTGNMSDIEQERYESLNTGGNIRLTAFQYSDADFPQGISIPSALLTFSPRFVELADLESTIGQSDFRLSGRLENFIPYVFNDGILSGNMLFSSGLLDLDEMLGEEPSEAEPDTVALTIVEIPGNVDFVLASSVDKLVFDGIDISQLRGRIIIRESKVIMNGVNMNLLGGSLLMNGEYNTQDMAAPFIDFSMNITDFDIPSSFHAFNTVEQLVPLAQNMRGSYSANMQMHSLLDNEMMPVLPAMEASGTVMTSSVELSGSETYERLSKALRLREDRGDFTLRDVDLSFKITGGRVYVDPFEMQMGPVNTVIGGSQGLDMTLDYALRMTVPRTAFGQGADQLIDNLASRAAERGFNIRPGENVNIDASITGTFSDPSISLDIRETARTAVDEVREQLRERATEEIEKRTEEVEDRVREEASERAEQIISEAEVRSQQIRDSARDAAEAIRKEAEANAARIEREAEGRGRIAEIAAKRTADALRREADEKADTLVREADERARKIIEEARREAEKLQ